jgi:hypothetical protein
VDFFVRTLFTVGLACVIGAVVGGGLKAFGIELPLLASRVRQILLAVMGAGMIGLALLLGIQSRPATPPQPTLADAAKPPAAAASPPESAAAPTRIPPPTAAPAAPQTPPAQTPNPGCPSADQALTCLPPSSRPVTFADPSAAAAVAWANVRNGLSTSQAEAQSVRRGATGPAARLCGIIQSSDSSPLALHLAAAKLQASAGSQGAVDSVCAALIPKLL